MKKIFFIFGVFVFQSCWAMDSNSNRLSEGSQLLAQDSFFAQIEDNFTNQECYEDKDLIFYFFNTGQGNCTLVKQGNKALLIDCGGSNTIAFDKTFTKCLGDALIECVIITHPHDDHYEFLKKIHQKHFSENIFLLIGGPIKWKGHKLINVVDDFGVSFKERYYTSNYCLANNIENPSESLVKDQNHMLILEEKLKNLFEGVEFNFLRFGGKLLDENNLNSYSLVFKITYKNNSILFTGDSTGDAFDRFLTQSGTNPFQDSIVGENREIIKNVNVFVMPHHGTDTDGSWRWTNRIIKDNYLNLVAMIACVDPGTSPYGHARNWIRDLIFPLYACMNDKGHTIVYSVKTGKGEGLKAYSKYIKETKNRLYETGLFTYGIVLVFSESGKIHILNSPNDTNLTHLPKNGEEKDDMGSEPQYPIVSVGQNHETFDVPNDGNCGVWAIMANLNDIHFKEATNSMGYRIATATEKQYEAMNVLRQEVAAQIEEETQQKLRIKGDGTFRRQNTEETINLDYWLQLEDFGIFAKYFNRPIVIQIGMGQAIRYEADGSISGFAPFDQLLADDSILIYYDGQTHYQAIKRKE